MMMPRIRLPLLHYHSKDETASSFFEDRHYRVTDSFCVSKIGRSEAVHISPDSTKVAYASFDMNKIVVFEIRMSCGKVEIDNCSFFGPDLNSPHDFTWIDANLIAVSNRDGPAVIFSIDSDFCRFIPEMSNSNSVAAIKIGGGTRLVFCRTNNSLGYCDLDDNNDLVSVGTLIDDDGLFDVPDGVAASPSGKSIAVTSALSDEIFLCDPRGLRSPVKIGSADRPHGVCFLSENMLLSTGGGDPFVYFWDTDNHSKFKFKVLEEDAYSLRGSDIEGGIKGACFCPNLKLLFMTCPNSPFIIYDASSLK